MTVPDPACRRATARSRKCGARLSAHLGPELACPDGKPYTRTGLPRVFKRYEQSAARASASFSGQDAVALAELVRILLAGGDTRAWSRRNAGTLGRLARVSSALQGRIAAQKAAHVPAVLQHDNQCDRIIAGVRCRARRSEHVGETGLCPAGNAGQTYKPNSAWRERVKQLEATRAELGLPAVVGEPATGVRQRAGEKGEAAE